MGKVKRFFTGVATVATTAFLTSPLYASAPTLTLPSDVDVTSVFAIAGTVLIGLVAMWGIRKVIKTVNRS